MKRARTTRAIEISARRTLRADPAVVWSILGDFGTEHRWASQLRHCQRSRCRKTSRAAHTGRSRGLCGDAVICVFAGALSWSIALVRRP
jgi:hypothetical protein